MGPQECQPQGARVALLAFLGRNAAKSPFCPRMPRRGLAFLGATLKLLPEHCARNEDSLRVQACTPYSFLTSRRELPLPR
jgi:hypothetical protein